MNSTETTLLELIKTSQFGNGSIPMNNCDWLALLEEAKQQSVLGLVYKTIPSSKIPQDKEWKYLDVRQKADFIKYLCEQKSLIRLLDDANIPYVIIKGCASAVYYTEPIKRSMGDIDILVRRADYDKAKALMFADGYFSLHEEDARNIAMKKHSLIVELHKQFSALDKDIECYISEGLKKRELRSIEGYSFMMLPKLANGLVLLEHMRQHLKGGMGLRQIIDWMMYVSVELDDSFWNDEFGEVAKEKGLDILARVATRMCQKYMGLSKEIAWCQSADEKVCDDLMNSLFVSGNFGIKQGTGKRVEAIASAFKREGFFIRLQKSGEHNWKAYKRHHWLKPFCWMYQGFRYLNQGIVSGRSIKQIKDDSERGKQRAELFRKLGLD